MAAFLSRTYASAGNRKTFTISTWLKITNISTATGQSIFYGDTAGNTNGTNDDFYYANNKIYFGGYNSTYIISTALFRDVSAWYHIVLSVDTTQATSANRIKLYVNGVEQARSEGAGYPAQNFDTAFIKSGAFQICGNSPASGYGFHNLANFYYVDGTALNATSFGETDATTGIWKPKSYTGSYGTNGFFLKFENSGSLGTDSSGNGNNWTVNNTPTQTLDTPSNVFATLNPLTNLSNGITLTNGNLSATTSDAPWQNQSANFGVSQGKWYWETKQIAGSSSIYIVMGIISENLISSRANSFGFSTLYSYGFKYYNGDKVYNENEGGTSASYGSVVSNNDIVGIAVDLDNLKIYWSINGTWQNSGVPTSGATGTGSAVNLQSGQTYFPTVSLGNGSGNPNVQFNFGNGVFGTTAISSPYSDGAGLGKFQYQPPTGYYALCTKNINVYG